MSSAGAAEQAEAETLEPPFVGRDDELRLLKDLFHATEREHKARLVSVVGQGGIGKSRLAWEFEKYIDGVVGRSIGTTAAPGLRRRYQLWALGEMVRGRAGIAETDDCRVARASVFTTLAMAARTNWSGEWVEPRLAGLLALDSMPPGTRDELFAAWRTFFERIAEQGPTILVFEDIQWADEGMLDFVTSCSTARALPSLLSRSPDPSCSTKSRLGLKPAQPDDDDAGTPRAPPNGRVCDRYCPGHSS